MKNTLTIILFCIYVVNANRILSETTQSSDKWKFKLFTSNVEQNSQSAYLQSGQVLLVQSLVSQEGFRQVKLTLHQKDSTQIGQEKIYTSEVSEYIRPKIILLNNRKFIFSWIQISDSISTLKFQIFDQNLNEISNQVSVGQIHKEVTWDLVSEFYSIQQINNDQILILLRDESKEKSWTGFLYNAQIQEKSNQFTLNFSNQIQSAVNSLNTIVILQKVQATTTELSIVITKIDLNGQVIMTRTLYKMNSINEIYYQPQIVALSNNNFVVLYQQSYQIVYYVFDQHFNSILFTSKLKFQSDQMSTISQLNTFPSWEYNNYFHGGQIQVITLEGSLVITGINYDNLRFQLVQLNNDYLEFVQLREIHYENLNIYKFNTQKLDDYSVFVSWIDGQPQTMLPEFVQSLYISSLNLKLTLTNCDANCQLCQADGICTKCNDRYQITNNSCILSCIENCSYCSTDSTCDVCNSEFNLNNQLQCLSKNNNKVEELQVSISETTYKFNQEFKILENNNILSIYQEQLGNEFNIQLRLIDTQGNVINSLQISANNVIDYDFIVLSTQQGYFFTLEVSEGYYVIKQKQFNPSTLEFSTVIRLQIQNQGFTYTQNLRNSLVAIEFETTLGFIVQGLDQVNNLFMSVYFYTYDGQFLSTQYLGFMENINDKYEFQYFDYQCDKKNLYIFINRWCDYYLVQFDQNGNRIFDQYNSQFSGYYWCTLSGGFPSFQKIPNSNKFMIAIEQGLQIFVFLWSDPNIIHQTEKSIKVRKPNLIAYSENKFSLLYEQFDYERRLNTLEYIIFNIDKVQQQITLNQRSLHPSNLQISNNNNEILIVSWLGYKANNIVTNQVYFQQLSLEDSALLGIGKQCPTNCEDCDDEKNCQKCKGNYLLSNNVCQLVCADGCSLCQENNLCLICQSGYILNSNNKCELSQQNQITVIKEDASSLQSIDLDTNSNGNILISWMNINPNTNIKQTYVKQIDQNGNQVGNDYLIDQCTTSASKVYSISSFNVVSTICGNVEFGANIDLHFYDTNFNFRFSTWSISGVKMIQYSILDSPYDILFISDIEFVIAFQIMNSISDVQLRILRVMQNDQNNSFFIISDKAYSNQQKINNLKISQDTSFIQVSFYINLFDENGFGYKLNKRLLVDFNCDLKQENQDSIQNLYYLTLQNSNRLNVKSDNRNIEISVINNNKQIHHQQIQISDQSLIQDLDLTSTESGFYVAWIEVDKITDFHSIKACGFYNNGTQIAEIQNMAQVSNHPTHFIIQGLVGNQLIALWYDTNSNKGQSIYASRYNKFLQTTPLNTVLCILNCESCTKSNTCEKCSQGHYYDSQKYICQLQCIQNCEICTFSEICDLCSTGYYLVNEQCVIDNTKHEEVILSQIKNSEKTRVSIASFNDIGFVVAWNDDLDGYQSIFLKFYDSQGNSIGDKILSNQQDKQFVKVESFQDDTFAIIWFEGNCVGSCRLQFQVIDRDGNIVINEITIAIVTLPPFGLQSPVVIKRKGRDVIIAYLSFENNSNIVAYYTIYSQDYNAIQNLNYLDYDQKIDNLEILVYNEWNYSIFYVRNNVDLLVLQYMDCQWTRKNIASTKYQFQQLSATVRTNSEVVLTWIEKTLKNGNLIDNVVINVCNYLNNCWWQKYLDTYDGQQFLPKIIGKYGFYQYYRYSIIYGTKNYLTNYRRKIQLLSYYYMDWDQYTNQLNTISYIIKYFDVKEFSNGENILVSVGQLSNSVSQIYITKFDILGQQLEFENQSCQPNCQECNKDLICISCKIGFIMNNGQCERECDLNCKYCDPYWNQSGFQCYECMEGYQLNSQQQCQPIDNSISQQLINTYQTGNQYDQKVAVLQNHQSIIVWTSENQNQNGKSIYMQLYDQQFNKVGAETLVTKDNIGVQEQPDITALPNNEFMIIWKDNNSSSGRRILMQRFNEKQERVGDAITVYDSQVDLYLNGEDPITYIDSYHQIISQQNGHISVLILLKVSSNLYDIRLKQFNEKYQEYNSITIGSTFQQDQCQATVLNNLLFVTWKSNLGIKLITINDQGQIVNGEIVQDSALFSNPAITLISQDELILAYSQNNQLIIKKYNIYLQKVNEPLSINSDFQITSLQVVNIDSGYVVVYKELKQTQYYSSDLIHFLSFDTNGGILTNSKVIVNNLYGQIRDIRLSKLSNGEVLVSWTQLINYFYGQVQIRNQNDLSGDGVYIKRFNENGIVQSIQNVVCQTYCKQCSKSNLCEVCADGYQFDYTNLLCQPICPENCYYCQRYLGQYKSYCNNCYGGYNINEQGDCVKINEQSNLQFYSLNGQNWQVRQVLSLENGSLVIIKQTQNNDDAQIKVINQAGDVLADQIPVNGFCCQKLIKATALTKGGFALVTRSFHYWESQYIDLSIYDNEGKWIKQQQLYTFTTWGSYYWWDFPYANNNLLQIQSLNDGGFILFYMTDNNGYKYHNPQMYFKIYNDEFYSVSNDIKLKTYFSNNQYWDWWNNNQIINQQSLSILETGNQIILSFGTCLYNGWEENQNYIQIFIYDKSGQFILNKQVEVINNLWWNGGYSPRYNLIQRSEEQFIIISFSYQMLYGNYFDTSFNKIIEKSIDLNFGWDTCYGCCNKCSNQNYISIVTLKNTIVISSKSNTNRLQLQSFNFNFESLNDPKQIAIQRQNSNLLWNHLLTKHQKEILLVSQIIDTNDDDNKDRKIVFQKFDSSLNKIDWTFCDENCINCLDNKKQCQDCKGGYFLNEQMQCQTYCQDDNCQWCTGYSSNIASRCYYCKSGYQLKDNSECVQEDQNKIRETLLQYSSRDIQNTPRIKTFSNGEFLLLILIDQNDIYAFDYDQAGNQIGNEKLLVSGLYINHFDFSVSQSEDQIVVCWTNQDDYSTKFKKFNMDFQQISDEIVIFDQKLYSSNELQITVEYFENNKIIFIIYNYAYSWMTIFDQQSNQLQFKQIEFDKRYFWGCYWWGCSWDCDWYGCDWKYCNEWGCWKSWEYSLWNNDEENRVNNFNKEGDTVNKNYIDYFSYWYQREPSILITEKYIILVAQHFDSIHAQTFDYEGNQQYQQYYKLFAPYQPSVAQLENGKIVIVWKDIIQNYNSNADSQSVPKYKQTVIAYTITDEQFNTVRIQYIGMDYVQEERPDVTAINNGFAISFSGRSERTNAYIDLRVAYFDLNGNLQTGFIPVSTQCDQPINSQIVKLNDGSILVSWYNYDDINVQKLDRNGKIIKFDGNLICPENCNSCRVSSRCDWCQGGYYVDSKYKCKLQTAFPIDNCDWQSYRQEKCDLCKEGYFLEQSQTQCTKLDLSQKVETKIAETNYGDEYSTLLLQMTDGSIIHLWIKWNYNIWRCELWGQKILTDGTQVLEQIIYTINDWLLRIKADTNGQQIVILILGYDNTQILRLDQTLNMFGDTIIVTEALKLEFNNYYDFQRTEIRIQQNGFLLQTEGNKLYVANQFSTNQYVRACRVMLIMIYDWNGQQIIPTFNFWIDGYQLNQLIDEYQNCIEARPQSILYEDVIYVFQNQFWSSQCFYIQLFDYNGQKIKEIKINWQVVQESLINNQIDSWDWFWNTYDGRTKLFREQNGDLCLINKYGQGFCFYEDFSIKNIINMNAKSEFQQDNFFLISLSDQINILMQSKSYGGVYIWNYRLFSSINFQIMEEQKLITQFSSRMYSFNVLKLQNGDLLFNWKDNSHSQGSIMIVRMNKSGQLVQAIPCLDQHCNTCSPVSTCSECNKDYKLTADYKCQLNCPQNCKFCQTPNKCDLCLEGMYFNDYQECVQLPSGVYPESPIPITRSDEQNKPRIAAFNDGSFIVVWQSSNQDGNGYGVYAQKFNSDSSKYGKEIRVNQKTFGQQQFPDVTILDDESVIIIWIDGDLENQANLYYQKFDKDLNIYVAGQADIIITQLSLYYYQYYDAPCVVQSLGQKFAVQWVNYLGEIDLKLTFGITVIDENVVQHETNQFYSQLELYSNKEIVTASNLINIVSIYNQWCYLQAAVYTLDGVLQRDFSISDLDQGCAHSPAITVQNNGEYLVAFQQNSEIYFKLYDVQFNEISGVFQVEKQDTWQDNPDVACLSNGNIIITWQNQDQSQGRSRKLRMQIFDQNGVAISTSLEVNFASIYAELPQISVLNNDDYAIVWQGLNVDPGIDSGRGIYLMLFNQDGTPINKQNPSICPDKCQQCDDNTSCTQCSIDYNEVNSVCVPKCPDQCLACTHSYICDVCQDGFVINNLGLCEPIGTDPLPSSILSLPDIYPSFSGSANFAQGAVVYSGTIIYDNDVAHLQISVVLYLETTNYSQTQLILIEQDWLNIYNSDILVVGDQLIIYWTQQSYSLLQIQVHGIIFSSALEIIVVDQIIDSFSFQSTEQVNRKVYLYFLEEQIFIFQSIQYDEITYQTYGHSVNRSYLRISEPNHMVDTQTQLYRKQIVILQNSFVFYELQQSWSVRIYGFDMQCSMNRFNEVNLPNYGQIDMNQISLSALQNSNFIIAWRQISTKTIFRIEVYFQVIDINFQLIQGMVKVTQSIHEILNLNVISTVNNFMVIWTEKTIFGDSLNANCYNQYGGYISSIEKINKVTNNVQITISTYFKNDQIYLTWVSVVELKYYFYIGIVSDTGVQALPGQPINCMNQCASCGNEYTCLTCINNYVYDANTKQCKILCSINCETCTSTGECKTCATGYSGDACIKNECTKNCELCNLSQNCLKCKEGFIQDQQDFNKCNFNCANCKNCADDTCYQCEDSYWWVHETNQCELIEVALDWSTIERPLRATFETGDYVLMWKQNEGIYIQLFRKNDKPVGKPTQVNKEDLINNNRRLLQESQDNNELKLFADLAIIGNELVVLWVDQTLGDMKVKFKKYDNNQREVSDIITIAEQAKQDLSKIAAPCLIKPTTNNQFIIGWFKSMENQIQNKATMLLQSFSQKLEPIGKLSTLLNADLSKVPVISADKDGVISITYSSQGYTYLAQMSQEGIFISDPIELAHPGQAFKSTNLNNGNMVFVFEAQSTNISPPQFFLSYEIMNQNKEFTQVVQLTFSQFGEEHPDVTKIKDGFIITWRTINKTFKSQDIYFQIFDNIGNQLTSQTMIQRQGIHPSNPRVQILNDEILLLLGQHQMKKIQMLLNSTCRNENNIVETPEKEIEIICSDNCQICHQNHTCLTCNSGYYMENSLCIIDCPLDCLQCNKPDECEKCDQGYDLTLEGQCEQIICDQGYLLNTDYECIPLCSVNCEQCQSTKLCTECQKGFVLNEGECNSSEIRFKLNEDNLKLQWYHIVGIVSAILILIYLGYQFKKKQFRKNQKNQNSDIRVIDSSREVQSFESRGP